jgi:hypothetical protein
MDYVDGTNLVDRVALWDDAAIEVWILTTGRKEASCQMPLCQFPGRIPCNP